MSVRKWVTQNDNSVCLKSSDSRYASAVRQNVTGHLKVVRPPVNQQGVKTVSHRLEGFFQWVLSRLTFAELYSCIVWFRVMVVAMLGSRWSIAARDTFAMKLREIVRCIATVVASVVYVLLAEYARASRVGMPRMGSASRFVDNCAREMLIALHQMYARANTVTKRVSTGDACLSAQVAVKTAIALPSKLVNASPATLRTETTSARLFARVAAHTVNAQDLEFALVTVGKLVEQSHTKNHSLVYLTRIRSCETHLKLSFNPSIPSVLHCNW